MKYSIVSRVILASVVIILASACQSPIVASINDSGLRPMADGFCVEYKRGLFYGDSLHNAPREMIWARTSVIVRPVAGRDRVKVSVVADCSGEKLLPARFTYSTSFVAGENGVGRSGWEIEHDATRYELAVLTPKRESLKYSLSENRLGSLQAARVAPRNGIVYLQSGGIDQDVFVFIDTQRNVAYRVNFAINEAMSKELGESFSLDGVRINLEVLH